MEWSFIGAKSSITETRYNEVRYKSLASCTSVMVVPLGASSRLQACSGAGHSLVCTATVLCTGRAQLTILPRKMGGLLGVCIHLRECRN